MMQHRGTETFAAFWTMSNISSNQSYKYHWLFDWVMPRTCNSLVATLWVCNGRPGRFYNIIARQKIVFSHTIKSQGYPRYSGWMNGVSVHKTFNFCTKGFRHACIVYALLCGGESVTFIVVEFFRIFLLRTPHSIISPRPLQRREIFWDYIMDE